MKRYLPRLVVAVAIPIGAVLMIVGRNGRLFSKPRQSSGLDSMSVGNISSGSKPSVPTNTPNGYQNDLVAESGDSRSLSMSELVARANANEPLAPADIQAFLAFISAPKPEDLTDGEWEERVNGVLNLLRRQTEDFETEDGRQEVSSGQFQVSSGESAVPGLTDVLLEMAERNGSKVLRLYAMQHLSLWFGKERDPAKRRAMVGLLEKLATAPGDETAGCAVLMLADMRRQTQDFKTQDAREEGAGSLAGSGAGMGTPGMVGGADPQGQTQNPSANTSATSASPRFVSDNDTQNPSAETSATSASPDFAKATPGKPRFVSDNDVIDWARVDGILEGASPRLVGEAGADVRISAIHTCVDRKDAGALPDLRRIASDAALVSTLRKAAIHAIGQLGTAEDVSLLDSLPKDDQNLSQALPPAKAALATRTKAGR